MSRFLMMFCIITTTILALSSLSYAQTCSKYSFTSNKVFASCSDLPVLNSFIHWNYDKSSQTIELAYRQGGASTSRWTAWGINPTSKGMVGTQALVAFRRSDGTMKAYTSPVSSYQTKLEEGDLIFPVSDLSATYLENENEIIIFAKIGVQNLSSSGVVNHVWQEGPVSGDSPSMHATSGSNVQSTGSLNLLSGETGTTSGIGNSKTKKRNIHGVLNAVGWGIMMPIGALFARYLKVFKSADPAWFYIHISCQASAYIIGVAGWATGIKLGSESPGITYSAHRTIGIILFSLGTLQVFALLLRPKKDHKYRFYWNVYHHTIGYTVIILSIINVFKGLNILDPENKWRNAYTGFIISLGIIAALLEAYTWCVVIKRKKSTSNVDNGANGFNAKTQEIV